MDAGELSRRYHDGASMNELARELSLPYSRIRRVLITHGASIRSRSDGVRLALKEGQPKLRGRKRIFSQSWRDNIRAGRRAWAEINAIGKSIKPSGYIEITRGPNKSRRVHDVIAETEIGRRLSRNEVVHHINGIKSDNRLSNLMVLTASQHASLHRWWDDVNGVRRQRDDSGRFTSDKMVAARTQQGEGDHGWR